MTTICKHCGASFDGGVEIIGQPGARLAALLHKLGSHMNKEHAKVAESMGVIGADFMGWLFLANFKSTDEKLNTYCDQRRWHIHQQTLNARYSDGALLLQSAELASRLYDHAVLSQNAPEGVEALRKILLEAFTGMRDDLEEPGRYGTAQPPTVIV